jgi:hypothetical protein
VLLAGVGTQWKRWFLPLLISQHEFVYRSSSPSMNLLEPIVDLIATTEIHVEDLQPRPPCHISEPDMHEKGKE